MVELFQALEEAIAATEESLAAAEELKRALLRELLTRGIDENGQARNPVLQPEMFKESSLGHIPIDWDIRSLPEIATYQNGRAFPSAEFGDCGVFLLRPGNMLADGSLRWDDNHTVRLPEKWLALAEDYIVRGDEVVMNLTAQSLDDEFLGRVCYTSADTFCLLNQRIARFRATNCHLPFLFWAFKGPNFRAQIDRVPSGTKVKHIYNKDIESILLPTPRRISEQQAIADILFMQNNQIQQQREHLMHLETLKAQAINRLLTGQHDAARGAAREEVTV
jgi:restriction endonuclease S subunit